MPPKEFFGKFYRFVSQSNLFLDSLPSGDHGTSLSAGIVKKHAPPPFDFRNRVDRTPSVKKFQTEALIWLQHQASSEIVEKMGEGRRKLSDLEIRHLFADDNFHPLSNNDSRCMINSICQIILATKGLREHFLNSSTFEFPLLQFDALL